MRSTGAPVAEWLRFFPCAKPLARAVLVAIPHAGAGPSTYASWAAALPGWLDLCAVGLPGREGRLAEGPARQIEEVAAACAAAIAPLRRPIILFGNSLGAWIAFETTHALASAPYCAPPLQLFASAAPAPHLPRRPPPARDDQALLDHLRRLDGTPEQLSAWGAVARRPCSVYLFQGNHFFLRHQRDAVIATLVRDVAGAIGRDQRTATQIVHPWS